MSEFSEPAVPDEHSVVLVAREGVSVRGFAVGRMVEAPPVYDPCGASCVVDDFAVADPAEWSVVGPPLLRSLRSWAAGRGATQMIVVTAQRDEAKRALLNDDQLSFASEWWVRSI